MEALDHSSLLILVAGMAGIGAVVASRLASVLHIPAPAVFLAIGVIAASWGRDAAGGWPGDADVATVGAAALVVLLFNGGFQGGWMRTRASVWPILGLGVIGTLATAALLASAAHWVLGLGWELSALVAIALAPTDPAAVFSVLGGHSLRGRAAVVLEGESGANDPVGIALMIGAIEFLRNEGSLTQVAVDFSIELAGGLAGGVVGGLLLARLLRRIHLGEATLHALLGIACAMALYGAVALLHGSGFLAVFIAGMFVGDANTRAEQTTGEVLAFGATAAEIIMFTMLGLRMPVSDLGMGELATALALFAILTFVVRPLVVLPLLALTGFDRREAWFIAWGGLKGAVPILLAAFAGIAAVPSSVQTEEIVFVAVAASIIIQGATLPLAARRAGLVGDDAAGSGAAA